MVILANVYVNRCTVAMNQKYSNELSFISFMQDMNEPASFVAGSPEGCPATKWDDSLPYHPSKIFVLQMSY